MFDSQDAMVRIDMSEYMEKHAVSRLVGAPPGYVGYDEGGQLTEAVRRRPYSVVLLDEIEKAHADVFNVLLQVMDDGRLTDGQGRTVDFKNTVLIMTSNIPGGRSRASEAHFKPEFINRLDEIVEFDAAHPRPARRRSSTSRSTRLARRVRERGIEIELTDDARTLLGNLGYDPTYGARPLKRVIQKRLVDPLALAILRGEFREGDTVRVDAADGELVFTEGRGAGAAVASWIAIIRTPAMPTYIMLTTLTPEGVQTVKNNPQRIQEVNKEVEQLGASVQGPVGHARAASTSSTSSRRRTRRRSRASRSSSDRAARRRTRR